MGVHLSEHQAHDVDQLAPAVVERVERKGLTYREAALRAGVSDRTIRRAVEAGEIPIYRIGRAVRIVSDGLEDFIAERIAEAAADQEAA